MLSYSKIVRRCLAFAVTVLGSAVFSLHAERRVITLYGA